MVSSLITARQSLPWVVVMRALASILLLSFLASAVFSQASGLSNVGIALSDLCAQVKSLVPIVVFLMVVVAGLVYVAGQVFGAEVRSRANVWATAMIIGAIICVLIIVILPTFLSTMYADPNASFTC